MRRRATSRNGSRGAVATAHPAASAAAAQILSAGGGAVDAAIAAQAVIAVVLPQAAGLGGDLLALVHHRGAVEAVNATGRSPWSLSAPPHTTGGSSVSVPGLVGGWWELHRRWGRLPLPGVLAPAVDLALRGIPVDPGLAAAVAAQRDRLRAGGADGWDLLSTAGTGLLWRQPELAQLLTRIAEDGAGAFYGGPAARSIVGAVSRSGGSMTEDDLAGHETPCPEPISVPWHGGTVVVQPPVSQGVLLAMALQKATDMYPDGRLVDDHVLVEIIGAAFEHRSDCGAGAALLDRPLDVDPHRASHRGGPRAYLHTAGVAVADGDGQVVSSLISVFDDFGSGVFVPELGIVLNNRAAGFTDGANTFGPGKRPVHTLAPAMVLAGGRVTAIATPGADGQIQTLLQVLNASRVTDLADAISALRWRSQDGALLVEQGHPDADKLAARGHRIVARSPGEDVFGAVVAAGLDSQPFAVADWRRQTHSTGVS